MKNPITIFQHPTKSYKITSKRLLPPRWVKGARLFFNSTYGQNHAEPPYIPSCTSIWKQVPIERTTKIREGPMENTFEQQGVGLKDLNGM